MPFDERINQLRFFRQDQSLRTELIDITSKIGHRLTQPGLQMYKTIWDVEYPMTRELLPEMAREGRFVFNARIVSISFGAFDLPPHRLLPQDSMRHVELGKKKDEE
ncbi:hypothetical protein V1477_004610 [Vespula maculifrons]|uniref:Uncharacterized protein n=1 Tax=Vespula maculifrons TaxID=7453 RepID=A0ABD2CMA8_VESMC